MEPADRDGDLRTISSRPIRPASAWPKPSSKPRIPAIALATITKTKKHQNSWRDARPLNSAYFLSVANADWNTNIFYPRDLRTLRLSFAALIFSYAAPGADS